RLVDLGDVGLHGPATELGRERLGLLGAAAVAEDDARPCLGQRLRDGAADPLRRAGDERRLALQCREGHQVAASSDSSFSSEARSYTEKVVTLRSIRRTRPV